MSKQSDAKKIQSYTEQPPIMHVCGSCLHYSSSRDNYYGEEKQKRCLLGGFAVKKTASCAMWAEVK